MRSRSLLWLCLAIPAFTSGACSCDPSIAGPIPDGGVLVDSEVPDSNACNEMCTPPGGTPVCVPPVDLSTLCTYAIVGYNNATCPAGSEVYDTTTCEWGCGTPPGSACVPPIPLQPGFLTQYMDSVAITDGAGGERIAISGYSPAWLDSGNIIWNYGDLVYGEFTPGGAEIVSFTIIDGKPDDNETNVQFDPAGWRGGNIEAGDDVGKYSAIATTAAGDVYIAYSDFTPGANKLKLAHRAPGSTTFTISVIDDSSVVTTGGAYYPSIVITGGVPVVAYGVREQATTAGSQPHGWVRVVTAASATPADSSAWTVDDRVDSISAIGCVSGDGLCASGDTCVAVGTSGLGECVTASTDCAPVCPAGMFGSVTVCANTLCRTEKTGGDLVDGQGLFNQLVVDGTGLALVYHDRSAGQDTGQTCETDSATPVAGAFNCTQRGQPLAFCQGATADVPNNNDGRCIIPNGNLWGARRDAMGAWQPRFLIDGYSRKQPTVGDCGQHASLVVDASGVWHVAYLDGTFDRIRFARVAAGATVGSAFGIVDDGTPSIGRPLDRADGRRRLVGGEISMALSAAGELRILYQDMTGPLNLDPLAVPQGPQPLLATRPAAAAAAIPWTVANASMNAPNSGYWTTQSTGLTTTGTSYCIWAQRAASSNDPLNLAADDGAETHALACDAD